MQPRSETIKSKSKFIERWVLVYSIIIFGMFFYLQVISTTDINEFIQTFVQVNITSTLSIAALVASMGAFRWEHYIKGVIHSGLRDKYERRKYVLKHAKKPLYRVIKLNSMFIIINIITLQSASIELKEIKPAWFTVPLFGINMFLIVICLIMGLILIYQSMVYMKELIFK
ncbi:hypothetical protein [Paenibacillus glacialis]|uniref:Uncharacterized protein n=1 Tax=Paenibacillus glacialis TaxID=494026 RepID=A0A168N0Y5_9BACL|nr:hypothetical protein [Paenibacillus glacialis]OAB45267.1 hypothetical protein PGLA_03140 [Paenibacillus glacialis]